jgi:hypothetical protein
LTASRPDDTWNAKTAMTPYNGQLEAKDCRVTYLRDGRALAIATIGRNLEALRAEAELERAIGARNTTHG